MHFQNTHNTNIEKIALFSMLIFSILILSPLIYFSFYNVPNIEDISLSIVWEYRNVWEYISELYFSFDGRYSTNFIHYFNPLAFKNYKAYQFLSVGFIFLFILASYTFFKSCFKLLKVTNWKRYELLISSTFIVACFFSWIYSMPHILFWFGSALVYLFPIICFLFFASFFINTLLCSNKILKIFYLSLASIFVVVAVGLSELSLFFISSFFLILIIYFYLKTEKIPNELMFLTIILVCCALFFLASPGIWKRKAMLIDDSLIFFPISALMNLLFHNLIFYLTALIPLFFCGIILNLYWDEKITIYNLSNKEIIFFTGLILLILFFTSIAYYIPSGHLMYFPKRIFNSIWGYFLFLFIPISFIIAKKIPKKIKISISIIAVLIININPNKMLFKSLNLIISKDHITHYNDFNKRVKLLEISALNNDSVVYLEPYKIKKNLIYNPPYIFPNREEPCWNIALEDYYGIDVILLKGDTITP